MRCYCQRLACCCLVLDDDKEGEGEEGEGEEGEEGEGEGEGLEGVDHTGRTRGGVRLSCACSRQPARATRTQEREDA